MAEQSGRDVVDQTLSGGEPSPSGVPASNNDKPSAGGDAGETQHFATTSETQESTDPQHNEKTTGTLDSQAEESGNDKDARGSPMDASKQGAGLVVSRALELNGIASGSDGGDETASQGGSESDASRTDGRHHSRTGSVKKLTTFKPVSFAKLKVPKAPGIAAAPKAPEKVPSTSTTPLGTPQPSSRPRLVAKTTTGMRDSFSKTGPGKPGASGPDPNQVWNKNRPVQPPPPKHLTDEELKQQYGIHMTSRIQEDGGGTEAKWADIDDDEDDWAPETIEWTDGTKVTLTHTDHPQPAPEPTSEKPKEAAPMPEQPQAKEPVKIAAPKPTTSVGPNPTVLRLGANAERQAKAASISSKGTTERAPSGSTSPAPPPAKSPWAPLPPVERVSPVNPPVQVSQPPRSTGPVSHSVRDDVRQGHLPPQEIAADDFNRTWRETAPGAPRELYNSRSGRYEPVPENRRGSWRHDQAPRPPAVLQRPTHVESSGPAEPSAAFQTHRSSHQDGMGWNRRRTSSNVSGGSGGFGRRMSFGRTDSAPRHMDGRRGSQTNGMGDDSVVGREHGPSHEPATSPQHASPTWAGQMPRSASAASSVEPQQATVEQQQATAVPIPEEDPLVLQERIMKETRAQARQRRLEQEERDRIEKEERIRKKLAALGPPPEKPQRKDASEATKLQSPAAGSQVILNSPPKPPVPELSSGPKQYGLMKVHHPDSVKKLIPPTERDRDRAAEKHSDKPSPPSQARHVPLSPPSTTRRVPPSPREPKREPVTTTNTAKQSQVSPQPTDVNTVERDTQWRGNLNVPTSYSPWTTPSNLTSNSASVKNPWKLLNNDRTLGNGIFDHTLGGFPSRDLPLRSQLGLDQPAVSPPTFSGQQESVSISPLPSPETRHATMDDDDWIPRIPRPIGPPSSLKEGEVRVTWSNFKEIQTQREIRQREEARKRYLENVGKPNPLFAHLEATTVYEKRGGSKESGKSPATRIAPGPANENNNGSPSNPLSGLDAPADGPFNDSNTRSISSVPPRSSRFFPQVSEVSKRHASEKHDSQRSPSPPPPEEVSTHPVYFGGSDRPLVHLPAPKPVVKLPPQVLAAPAPPTFASMAAAPPRGPPAPAPTAISWQEKINDLFGKKTPAVVEKKSVLAITSATKEPLDVPHPAAAVSVSLPNNEKGMHFGDGHLAVRQVEDQDEIFEDREPGSLPSVRVPNMAPWNAWQAAPAPPASRLRAKVLRPMQVHSVEPYWVGNSEKDATGNTRVQVRMPGAATAKTMSLPKKNGGPGPRQRNSSNYKPRKGPKPQNASGGNSAPKKTPSQQPGSNASSSPRHPVAW